MGESRVAKKLAPVVIRDSMNRREERQTDEGGGGVSERESETVFLSLGGVAALFHQP